MAIKHLYSRNAAAEFNVVFLILTLVSYTVLCIGMSGVCVPMGNFTPSMLIGAVVGRVVGELITTFDNRICFSTAGIYSLIGSAAMLSGFTHMTIAIVVLLAKSCQASPLSRL